MLRTTVVVVVVQHVNNIHMWCVAGIVNNEQTKIIITGLLTLSTSLQEETPPTRQWSVAGCSADPPNS